jgi:hypothetical protein
LQQEVEENSSHNLKSLTLSNMVTVALRLILDREEFPDKMIEEFSVANKLRNKIIHTAKMDESKDDAEKAYKTVSKIISIINPKLDDYQ